MQIRVAEKLKHHYGKGVWEGGTFVPIGSDGLIRNVPREIGLLLIEKNPEGFSLHAGPGSPAPVQPMTPMQAAMLPHSHLGQVVAAPQEPPLVPESLAYLEGCTPDELAQLADAFEVDTTDVEGVEQLARAILKAADLQLVQQLRHMTPEPVAPIIPITANSGAAVAGTIVVAQAPATSPDAATQPGTQVSPVSAKASKASADKPTAPAVPATTPPKSGRQAVAKVADAPTPAVAPEASTLIDP